MKRKRKHIPLSELLASALAELLAVKYGEHELVHMLEEQRASARAVRRLFTPDHRKLYAWGGEDLWWNLDWRRRDAALKLKDRADTSRVAKALRIDAKYENMRRKLLGKPSKRLRRRSRWPLGRPLRGKNVR